MKMGRHKIGIAFGFALVAAPFAGQAQVQVPAPGAMPVYPMIAVPEEVRSCICLEQATQQLSSEVSARRRIYDDRRQELARLDAELARMRQSMNVENAAEVAAFRQMLDRRNATFDALNREAVQDLNVAVDRYNRAAADYNQRCYARTLDPAVVATVRQSLVCPAP